MPGGYAAVETGLELYDLVADIGETRDVAAAHPGVVAELQDLAETARAELGDALTGRRGSGEREPGRLPAGLPDAAAHAALGASVTLAVPASPRYPGGGPATLTDGRRGTLDPRDGRWLGFEGEGLEAVIDLGREVPVMSVSCGFLQDQPAWIFLPTEVRLFLSQDGVSYNEAGRVEREVVSDQEPKAASDEPRFPATQARFIKIVARNVGICPSGHPGEGSKAWLFVDEIVVR